MPWPGTRFNPVANVTSGFIYSVIQSEKRQKSWKPPLTVMNASQSPSSKWLTDGRYGALSLSLVAGWLAWPVRWMLISLCGINITNVFDLIDKTPKK